LISSLLCENVIASSKVSRILGAIQMFLRDRDSVPVLSAIQVAFDGATPAQLIDFDAVFPLAQASLELHEHLLIRFVCEFLDQPFDRNFAFGLQDRLRSQFEAEPDSDKSFCLLNLLGKLAVVQLKLATISSEKLDWLREQLSFEIRVPFGEGMLLKERMKLIVVYLGHIAEYAPDKLS
jgi:hypothetical protein